MKNKITIFAPATIANLAVGFDQLGLAISSIGDTISITLIDSDSIKITCDNENIPTDKRNTAYGALKALKERLKYNKGFSVHIKKGIPIGSGLGGSAASAVGAVVGANKLLNNPLSQDELLLCALAGEELSGASHFDNIAPCLNGGITLVSDNKVISLENNIKNLSIILIHPDIIIKTAESRKLLPSKISLNKHVKQSGYLARFIIALSKGNFNEILLSCRDVIIEPIRHILIKGFLQIQEEAKKNNMALSISGSGPTMFALSNKKNNTEDELKLRKVVEIYYNKFWIKTVEINNEGAHEVL